MIWCLSRYKQATDCEPSTSNVRFLQQMSSFSCASPVPLHFKPLSVNRPDPYQHLFPNHNHSKPRLDFTKPTQESYTSWLRMTWNALPQSTVGWLGTDKKNKIKTSLKVGLVTYLLTWDPAETPCTPALSILQPSWRGYELKFPSLSPISFISLELYMRLARGW